MVKYRYVHCSGGGSVVDRSEERASERGGGSKSRWTRILGLLRSFRDSDPTDR